jgi:hypothetical protein
MWRYTRIVALGPVRTGLSLTYGNSLFDDLHWILGLVLAVILEALHDGTACRFAVDLFPMAEVVLVDLVLIFGFSLVWH